MGCIEIIGIGTIGMPLALMLASSGYDVIGVDKDENRVNSLAGGSFVDSEAGINSLLHDAVVRKRLLFQRNIVAANVYIIAVSAAVDEKKQAVDLSNVLTAVESIIPYLRRGNLVIIESTVPPLTCREVITPLIERTGLEVGDDILLCYCPERVMPGNIVDDFIHNDRIMGGTSDASARKAREIYASFAKGNIYLTDDVTAELVKLMENTYRDVNIALANEFAVVAEGLRVNIMEAIKLANKHPRVHIHNPGIGTGGFCIPVSSLFVRQAAPESCRLMLTARGINDEVPIKIAAQIWKGVRGIETPHIVALGVTYKPNVADTGRSPALRIIRLLRDYGCRVDAFDPLVKGLEYHSISEIASGADCLAVLVEHGEIKEELSRKEDEIKKAMRCPLILRFYAEDQGSAIKTLKTTSSACNPQL